MRLSKLQKHITTSIQDSFLQNPGISYKTKGIICEAMSRNSADFEDFIQWLQQEDGIDFNKICEEIEEFGWSFSKE